VASVKKGKLVIIPIVEKKYLTELYNKPAIANKLVVDLKQHQEHLQV
jgi:hypothetical protein